MPRPVSPLEKEVKLLEVCADISIMQTHYISTPEIPEHLAVISNAHQFNRSSYFSHCSIPPRR